jgi:biopolymer transport protein ExbD
MGASMNDNQEDAIATINVTPFVDIILVVLIIFMVTTPFIMNPSINIQLPKSSTGDKTIPTQLNIGVSSEGKIYLNGKLADETTLSIQAKAMIEANPDLQAVINADKDVSHGRVITIIDKVKTAGIEKFAISIEKSN